MEKQHKAAGAAELQDRESQHCETHPLEKGHFALSIENRNMLVTCLITRAVIFYTVTLNLTHALDICQDIIH